VSDDLIADFDAWARLSARLLRRGALDCARIIRDAGVEHQWHAADAHWYGQLLADVEAGRSDRVDRYRRLCMEAMAARRRGGETVPSPLDVLRLPVDDRGGEATPDFASGFASKPELAPSPGQLGKTMNMAELDVEAVRGHAKHWAVEDYAWLCAELERFPEREDQVWAARGITGGDTRRAVREVWDGRLRSDRDLRSRYDELLAAYRQTLRRR